MAAKRPTFGVDHPTVVPTNFDPERTGPVESDSENDADGEVSEADDGDGTVDAAEDTAIVDDRDNVGQ